MTENTQTSELEISWYELQRRPELLDEFDIEAVDGVSLHSDQDQSTQSWIEEALLANNAPTSSHFYKVSDLQKTTLTKLFNMLNSTSLYPETSLTDTVKILRDNNGRRTPDFILDAFPSRRRKTLEGTRMRVAESSPEDLILDYGDNPQFATFINVTIGDIPAELMKAWLPLMTGGLTFNQLAVANKGALHVFPSFIMKNHDNAHIGQLFKAFTANTAMLFDSYCFPDTLAKSLTGDTVVEVALHEPADAGFQTQHVPYE